MKKLILFLFVVGAVFCFTSAKAQNQTNNASNDGVPIASPATQTNPSFSANPVTGPVTIAPVAPPLVAIAGANTNIPGAPTSPIPPVEGVIPPPSTQTTTYAVPQVDVPPTVSLPQSPDVRLRRGTN